MVELKAALKVEMLAATMAEQRVASKAGWMVSM